MLTSLFPAIEVSQAATRADRTRTTTVSDRLDWIDACKGICIVLVVFGHITGGLETSGTVAYGSMYDRLRSWVYLFHMPAFFFLSGLLASRTMGRPIGEVLGGKLRTLAYPYILWTGIYLLVQEALARYANNPPDLNAALQLLWKPYGYGLWFLYSLFLISLGFQVFAALRIKREAILIGAIAMHGLAVLNLFSFWPILNQAMVHFIYFAVGGLYARPIFKKLSSGRSTSWFSWGLVALVLMTVIATSGISTLPLLACFPAFIGIAGVICLARGLTGSLPGTFFGWLGFSSLEIYLGHPLFGTASRALLGHSPIHGSTFLIASGVAAGIFGSLALAVFCRRLYFPYLYRWPGPQRRAEHQASP